MSFTLFAGRGHVAREIVEILEDLAALHLVDNFAWVDIDAFERSDSRIFTVQRSRGELRSGYFPLTDVLSNVDSPQVNRVIINVLGQDGGGITAQQIGHFDSIMEAVNHNLQIKYANVVVPYDLQSTDRMPLFRGYINLMISPEDSDYPGKAAAPVDSRGKRGETANVSATTLASLCGLWEGSVECPLSKLDADAADKFRLVRAYYHRVDGQLAQSVIKSRVFDTTENPLPTVYTNSGGRAQVDHTDDPAGFAAATASELVDYHWQMFSATPIGTAERRGKNVQGSEARKQLSSDWAKALITGPGDFFLDVRAAFQELHDDQMQKIYGLDSRVVVGELRELRGEQRKERPALPGPDQVARDLSDFWKAYKNSALTQLDAKPRLIRKGVNEELTPAAVWNSDRNSYFVARKASDVIPGPSTHFGEDLSVELQAIMGGRKVAPYDIRGSQEYEQQLQRSGQSTGRIMGDFGRWKQSYSGSFAYALGSRLLSKMDETQKEKQRILRELERANSRTLEEIQGSPGLFSRMAGWITFLTFLMFFSAKVIINRQIETMDREGWLAYVNVWDGLSSSAKTWILLGWFTLWLIFYVSQKFAETRARYAIENGRDKIIDSIESLEDQLYQCDLTLHRLEVAYQQFVSVSDYYGALLEKPFGEVSTHVEESTVPSNPVSRSVTFRELAPEDPRVTAVIRERRSDLYGQGWLDTYVERGQRVAIDNLARNHNRRINPDGLLAVQGGRDAGNKLTTLADYVQGDEFRGMDRSKEDWAKITDEMRHHSAHVLETDPAGVNGQDPSLGQLVDTGRFVGGIASSEGRTSRLLELDPSLNSFEKLSSEVDAVGSSELLVQVGHLASEADLQRGPATDHSATTTFTALPGEAELDSVPSPNPHSDAGSGPAPSFKPAGPAMPGEDVF